MLRFFSHRDEVVIGRVLAGQREEFGLLVHRYLPAVQALARARVGAVEAEDVVQEAFLRAYQHLDELRERRKFGAWLGTITRNIAATRARSQAREAPLPEREEALPPQPAPDHGARELRAAVQAQVEALEPEARELVQLYYFAGNTTREIARLLELSDAAVRKRLQRARTVLGERLLAALGEEAPPRHARKKREAAILGTLLATGTAWQAGATAAGAASAVGAGAGAMGLAMGKTVAGAAVLVVVAAGAYLVMAPEPEPVAEPESIAAVPAEVPAAEPANAPETQAPAAPETVPAAAPVFAAATEPEAAGILVRGRVLRPDDTPVPEAKVTGRYWAERRDDAPESVETMSDEHGNFQLRLVQPWEMFIVRAEKAGYVQTRSLHLAVPPEGLDGLEVPLFLEATASGQVLNPQGHRVAGVPVTARNNDVEGILWTVSTTTDEQGLFTLEGMTPGSYSLAVIPRNDFKQGMEDLRIAVAEAEQIQGLRVVYEGEGLVIAGRVITEDGSPIPRAFVEGHPGRQPRSTYTAEDGSFKITQLPEGEFLLRVSHQAYQGESFMLAAGASEVEVVLRERGSVTGTVVDARTKQPLPEFEVAHVEGRTATFNMTLERSFQGFNNPEGVFEVGRVALDEATLIARAPGRAPAFTVVSLEAGEHLEGVVIALEQGLSIEGRVVTSSGEPVAGAFVLRGQAPYLPPGVDANFMASQTAQVALATTDEAGRFRLEGLAPGAETLSAWHRERGKGEATAEINPDAPPIEIVVRKGQNVHGTVYYADAPAAGITVFATPEGGMGQPFAMGQTNADGRFTLAGVPAGMVTIAAAFHDPLRARRLMRTIELLEGQDVNLTLTFQDVHGSIVGNVLVGSVPARAGMVQARTVANGSEEVVHGQIQDGTFEVAEVAAGPVELLVNVMLTDPGERGSSATGLAKMLHTDVSPGHVTELEIAFAGTAGITGHIATSLPHLSLHVLEGVLDMPEVGVEMLAALQPHVRASTGADPDGLFLIEGLDPGTYTVLARASASNGPDWDENIRFATAVVTLQEGEMVEVNFDLH